MGVPLRVSVSGVFSPDGYLAALADCFGGDPRERGVVFLFMAAMKCSKLQKEGVKDDELPWWVYAGLIVAPLVAMIGIMLLK